MPPLLEEVRRTAVNRTGFLGWFEKLAPADQRDITNLLALKKRDEAAVPHSFVQLAQIIIRRYGLKCKECHVRGTLSRMYRECQGQEKASRKK